MLYLIFVWNIRFGFGVPWTENIFLDSVCRYVRKPIWLNVHQQFVYSFGSTIWTLEIILKKFYDQPLFWSKKTLTVMFIILPETASKIGF